MTSANQTGSDSPARTHGPTWLFSRAHCPLFYPERGYTAFSIYTLSEGTSSPDSGRALS